MIRHSMKAQALTLAASVLSLIASAAAQQVPDTPTPASMSRRCGASRFWSSPTPELGQSQSSLVAQPGSDSAPANECKVELYSPQVV